MKYIPHTIAFIAFWLVAYLAKLIVLSAKYTVTKLKELIHGKPMAQDLRARVVVAALPRHGS